MAASIEPPADPPRRRDLFGGPRGRVLAFCWLGWVFDFYDLILFAFVKVQVGKDLGLGLTGPLAWIDGATLLATAVGGFALGRLADRHGRRRAMVLGILIFSAGTLATAAATGFWSLLMARMLTGLGVGGEWGIAHALVAETFAGRARLRAAALLQAGAPVAMALAAVVGCIAAPQIGWRACFALSASTALLAAAARAMVPVDSVPVTSGEARAERTSLSALRALWQPALRRASAGLLLLLGLHMTGFWCTYAWLPAALMVDLHVAPAQVAWFQVQINAVHVLADLGYPLLAERVGRARAFRVTCVAFAFGLAALALGFEGAGRDWRAFGWAAAAVGLGAGTWSAFGPMFAANYPPGLRATAASGFYNLARGGQLVTQPLVGSLAAAAGTLTVGLWIGVATALASAACLGLVPRLAPDEKAGATT
ncbi:MAG: MFS transporter [Planctomycetota bacterium]